MKIQTLQLFTRNLDEQVAFYTDTLEFELVERTDTNASIRIGDSVLRLVHDDNATPYHYAINIPSNQENEALTWLKERIEVLTFKNADIQYFDFWDAYAIYFYDRDRNIGEFIARRELDANSTTTFGPESILGISEIGLPTTDIKREYALLNDEVNLPIFFGDLDRFCTVGDAHGLFILIDKTVKKQWFPTTDEPISSDFEITFSEGDATFRFVYEDETLRPV